MSEVTRILSAIEEGDPHAAEQLLPLVYAELRRLAAEKMAQEKPGQTLQATALVHEAYLRLVDNEKAQQWDSRGHFFAAAAEAMRRILVENARRKGGLKHGGGRRRPSAEPRRRGAGLEAPAVGRRPFLWHLPVAVADHRVGHARGGFAIGVGDEIAAGAASAGQKIRHALHEPPRVQRDGKNQA